MINFVINNVTRSAVPQSMITGYAWSMTKQPATRSYDTSVAHLRTVELKINDYLITALEELELAKIELTKIDSGMASDPRRPIADLESMLAWTQSHPGWVSEPFEAFED